MRNILRLFVLVLLASPVVAEAQQVSGSVEFAHYLVDASGTPEIHTYLHGNIRGKLGWTSWTLNNGAWSEALIGLTYAPGEWVEVSASAGLEKDSDPARFGSSIWLGKGRFSLIALGEKGGSGTWHKEVAQVRVNKTMSLGVLDQKFLGYGPYMEVNVKKFTAWGTVVGKSSGALGVKLNF